MSKAKASFHWKGKLIQKGDECPKEAPEHLGGAKKKAKKETAAEKKDRLAEEALKGAENKDGKPETETK